MIRIRRATERGYFDYGWLQTSHTFSFGDYYAPTHRGFHSLRVINEDIVQPGKGFAEHPHEDMEILTYVISGALAHRDSTGGEGVIRPGEVQRMSAGTGIRHSEYNAGDSEPVHLLQIWIRPDEKSITPGYEQKPFPPAEKQGRFREIAASGGNHSGVLSIHQDVRVFDAAMNAGQTINYALLSDRHAWVQVIQGSLVLNNQQLQAGDGAAVSAEPLLAFSAETPSDLLLFDLAEWRN